MTETGGGLKGVLERLYAKYNRADLVPPDPLQFVYRYDDWHDKEIAGFVSAALAYGRVEQIQRSLQGLFEIMGASPRRFVEDFNQRDRRRLSGFRHRFTSGQDLGDLFALLQQILTEAGSIEHFFAGFINQGDTDILPALGRFCDALYDIQRHRAGEVSRGLRYLLAHPGGGSACKRLNLFLRWMVRCDAVDPGLWKSVDRARLVVPVDVHMARLCEVLGLWRGGNVSLKAARRITSRFAEIEPADPVKYDFALSRIGILEHCTGRMHEACAECELFDYCRRHVRYTK